MNNIIGRLMAEINEIKLLDNELWHYIHYLHRIISEINDGTITGPIIITPPPFDPPPKSS